MALCGGIVLEEALDLSFDRLLVMINMLQWIHKEAAEAYSEI